MCVCPIDSVFLKNPDNTVSNQSDGWNNDVNVLLKYGRDLGYKAKEISIIISRANCIMP